MIVVDTSALIAVLLEEDGFERINATLEAATKIVASATTIAECLVVSSRKGQRAAMTNMIDLMHIQVYPDTHGSAERVADTYDRWGKGVHPAGLNICDCFAYALAKELDCPLLFVGDDFSRTDVVPAFG
jgi:ribonuclease VapC